MADRMSFDKYIDNPSLGAQVITNRNMYKAMYKSKFYNVMLREQGVVEYFIYKGNDSEDSYYIHLKIPSEVVAGLYYDVVVRLYTTINSKKSSQLLRDHAVQFYSNDPAFVYTFAHAFAKHDIFIKDLSQKMAKKALSKVAKTRNPLDSIWYVKSLYFAYLAMERYDLFNRTILDREAKPYNKKVLLSTITDADDKIRARQEQKPDKPPRQIKDDKKQKLQDKRNETIRSPLVKSTKKVRNTKTTSNSNNKTSITKKSNIITAKKNIK